MTETPTAPATRFGVLVHAARPRTLPAAAAPVLVGTALAWSAGVFSLWPALVALTCALLLQVGTNFANDYFDFVKGADNDDRAGELRVTQAGLVSPGEVKGWMVTTFALAVALGASLVWIGGWPILVIGLASVAAGVLYTGGPWPFGYHGLGDLFVFVFFGLAAVAGTYYVQALEWLLGTLVAGAGIGALTTNILVVNNLRDIPTDTAAGKRTLAVLLGVRGTQVEYAVLLALAMAAPVVGVVWFAWSPWSLVALVAGVVALGPLGSVFSFETHGELDPVLASTARVLAIYGVLLSLGLVL